jgi:cytochrome c oxidase cbb3-type subunit 3
MVIGALAQQTPNPPARTNPLSADSQIIQEGHEIYNRTCTQCHGVNGTVGVRGPALAGGRSYVRETDASMFDAIHLGIAGTGMPPSGLPVTDVWKIVVYIRSLRASASDAFVPGDAVHGEQIFWGPGGCNSCHTIGGHGGILGPDLSNIGGERTLLEIRDALIRSRRPISQGYQPVDVLTTDGRHITGVLKNENNFSLQILDSKERLQLFTRDELRQIDYKNSSLMPANYDKQLRPDELQDLLSFLSRQTRDKSWRSGCREDKP